MTEPSPKNPGSPTNNGIGNLAFSNLGARGESARKWRRGIGALAVAENAAKRAQSGSEPKPEKDTRARKFPLELPDNAFNFEEAEKLFNVVEGIEKGSLVAFLCAAHLSGFRMFGGAGDAHKFRPDMKQSATVAQDDNRRLETLRAEDADIFPHQVVAVVARQTRRDLEKEDIGKNKNDIKLRLLGGSENAPHGLSWLFGTGWEMLVSEIGDEEIAQEMNADIKRVRQLREYARAVPPPHFYKKKNYANFRVQVAQKLGSWIGNYWKRLAELGEKVDNPPTIALSSELPDDERLDLLLKRANITRSQIRAGAESLPKMFRDARDSLNTLAGRGNTLPRRADIEKFGELNAAVEELAGHLRTLHNFAEQRAGKDDADEFWKSLHNKLGDSLAPLNKLEKLNRISGGTPDAEKEVRETEAAFNALWRHCRAQFAAVADNAAGMRAVLESIAEREKRTLREREHDESAAPEFAVRKILQQIGNAARNMRPENMEIVAEFVRPLFAGRKDANRYFNNRLGALYRSPFSRSVHKPYDLDWRAAEKINWIEKMETAAERMETRLAEGCAEDWRDWLECRMLAMFFCLQGLPNELPREKISALADIPAEAEEHLRFYPALRKALSADSVSRDIVISGFNQLRSALRGLAFKVMRPNFIVRAVFHPVEQDVLIYAPKNAPKNGEWIPPPRHRARYAETFAAMDAEPESGGTLEPQKAVDSLLRARRRNGKGNAHLTDEDRAALTQTPHDWLFPADNWNIAAEKTKGVVVRKSKEAQKTGFGMLPKKPVPALRLIGPSSLKSALDDCLRGRVVLGVNTLIVEREYAQKFGWQNGRLSLSVSESRLRAEIAVPIISETRPAAKNSAFYDHFVAIDLGERGIGFSVFGIREWLNKNREDPLHIKDGRRINGTISIPSVRALIRAVHRHRGRAQPGQKVRDSHSRALEKRRKNVIGDICHAIDSLCAKYNGFPVLEWDVGNLESGGNQLKLVYGSVSRRYLWSGTDAHKKQRGEHWFVNAKSGKWSHPYLIRKTKEKDKALNLYPGTGVSAAGTSQICSVCRRNALSMLKKLPGKFQLDFRNGAANLADGETGEHALFLYEKTVKRDARELRRLRRQKRRPQLQTPLHGVKKAGELRALVKFNMRRPPVSTQSRDTSQSRYFCVFADCRAEMHADENAAVNIGRRFLSDLRRELSRQKAEGGDS